MGAPSKPSLPKLEKQTCYISGGSVPILRRKHVFNPRKGIEMTRENFELMVNSLVEGDICPPRGAKELCRSGGGRYYTVPELDQDPDEEDKKECRQCWRNWFSKWDLAPSNTTKNDEGNKT